MVMSLLNPNKDEKTKFRLSKKEWENEKDSPLGILLEMKAIEKSENSRYVYFTVVGNYMGGRLSNLVNA